MSTQVDTALVNQYRSNIEIQFQQKGSRLRRAVRNESQNGEYAYYDRIGPTSPSEITTRHADTVLVDTPHTRRRVALKDYVWADMIDDQDKIRMLADPTSSYVMNAVHSFGRQMDDDILAAAVGNAYSGKAGGTTVALPAGQHIEVNLPTGADRKLTIEKLMRARRILDDAEALEEGENAFIAVTPQQIESLLSATEVTSIDYNTVRALVNGDINSFMGFEFIRLSSARMTTDANSDQQIIAWARNGLLLASAMDIKVNVTDRADKNHNMQVHVKASFGATRLWDEKVTEIACDTA